MSKEPIDDGGPAFPQPGDEFSDGERQSRSFDSPGMTLRDYFAAKALQAEIITSCSDATPEAAEALAQAAYLSNMNALDRIALNAYRFADAMLKARGAR